jgi:hypothetical protein
VELKAQDYRRRAEEAEERAKTAHDVLAKAWKQVAADYRYLADQQDKNDIWSGQRAD